MHPLIHYATAFFIESQRILLRILPPFSCSPIQQKWPTAEEQATATGSTSPQHTQSPGHHPLHTVITDINQLCGSSSSSSLDPSDILEQYADSDISDLSQLPTDDLDAEVIRLLDHHSTDSESDIDLNSPLQERRINKPQEDPMKVHGKPPSMDRERSTRNTASSSLPSILAPKFPVTIRSGRIEGTDRIMLSTNGSNPLASAENPGVIRNVALRRIQSEGSKSSPAESLMGTPSASSSLLYDDSDECAPRPLAEELEEADDQRAAQEAEVNEAPNTGQGMLAFIDSGESSSSETYSTEEENEEEEEEEEDGEQQSSDEEIDFELQEGGRSSLEVSSEEEKELPSQLLAALTQQKGMEDDAQKDDVSVKASSKSEHKTQTDASMTGKGTSPRIARGRDRTTAEMSTESEAVSTGREQSQFQSKDWSTQKKPSLSQTVPTTAAHMMYGTHGSLLHQELRAAQRMQSVRSNGVFTADSAQRIQSVRSNRVFMAGSPQGIQSVRSNGVSTEGSAQTSPAPSTPLRLVGHPSSDADRHSPQSEEREPTVKSVGHEISQDVSTVHKSPFPIRKWVTSESKQTPPEQQPHTRQDDGNGSTSHNLLENNDRFVRQKSPADSEKFSNGIASKTSPNPQLPKAETTVRDLLSLKQEDGTRSTARVPHPNKEPISELNVKAVETKPVHSGPTPQVERQQRGLKPSSETQQENTSGQAITTTPFTMQHSPAKKIPRFTPPKKLAFPSVFNRIEVYEKNTEHYSAAVDNVSRALFRPNKQDEVRPAKDQHMKPDSKTTEDVKAEANSEAHDVPSEMKLVINAPSGKKPVINAPSEMKPVIDAPSEMKPVIHAPSGMKLVIDAPSEMKPVIKAEANSAATERVIKEEVKSSAQDAPESAKKSEFQLEDLALTESEMSVTSTESEAISPATSSHESGPPTIIAQSSKAEQSAPSQPLVPPPKASLSSTATTASQPLKGILKKRSRFERNAASADITPPGSDEASSQSSEEGVLDRTLTESPSLEAQQSSLSTTTSTSQVPIENKTSKSSADSTAPLSTHRDQMAISENEARSSTRYHTESPGSNVTSSNEDLEKTLTNAKEEKSSLFGTTDAAWTAGSNHAKPDTSVSQPTNILFLDQLAQTDSEATLATSDDDTQQHTEEDIDSSSDDDLKQMLTTNALEIQFSSSPIVTPRSNNIPQTTTSSNSTQPTANPISLDQLAQTDSEATLVTDASYSDATQEADKTDGPTTAWTPMHNLTPFQGRDIDLMHKVQYCIAPAKFSRRNIFKDLQFS